MIESNPEMYFKFNVSDRKYLNYSYETLNSFLVVKNILGSDSSLVGHIDAIINSFKVLWYNKALQKYYGSLVLFARARIQLFNQVNRINKDDDDKISVVFQDTKITNENKMRLLDQASANGDIWAIRTRLNEMIRRKGGYSSTENSKVEIGLLEKLANDGDVESMYSLGEIYRDGGEKTLSMMWYEKAASENYSDAMVKIGYLFESDFKYKEAIVWYEKAAKLENAEGMCEVGDAENDMVLATEWLLKSATFGIASRSYSTLGRKYFDNGDIFISKNFYAKAIFLGGDPDLPDEIEDDSLFYACTKEKDFYNDDKEYIENKLRELDKSAT